MTTPLDVQAIRRHILATMGFGLWVGRDSTSTSRHLPCRFSVPKPQINSTTKNKPKPQPKTAGKSTASLSAKESKKSDEGGSVHANCLPILESVQATTYEYQLVMLAYDNILLVADWLGVTHNSWQEHTLEALLNHLRKKRPTVVLHRVGLDHRRIGETSVQQRSAVLTVSLQMYYQQILGDCRLMLLTPVEGIYWGGLSERQIPAPTLDQLYNNPTLIDQFLT